MNMTSFANQLLQELRRSISLETVAGNIKANQQELGRIQDILEQAGFYCQRFEGSPHAQPAMIAHLIADQHQGAKLCVYNHYDVEPIHKKSWHFPPFTLTEEDNRLYGRGIADNKGVLWARILTVVHFIQKGGHLPSMLWLIQGEEEVGPTIAYKPFKQAMADFQADVHLEETGYYTEEGQQFLLHPANPLNQAFVDQFAQALKISPYFIQERHLNKSYAQQPCPFLTGIPEESLYLSFGPNDPNCRIHSNNESLDRQLLLEHAKQFEELLDLLGKMFI